MKQHTYQYDEKFFWGISTIPLCVYAYYKMSYFMQNFLPNTLMFGIFGVLITLIFLCIFFIKEPLCKLFTRRSLRVLLCVILFAAAVCAFILQDQARLFNLGKWLVYFLLLSVCIKCLAQQFRKIKLPTRLIYFLFGVFLIEAFMLANTRTLYYWDNIIYHDMARWLVPSMEPGNLGNLLSQCYYSVLHWDYNYIGAFLPALFMRLLGQSRNIFILINVCVYLVPVIFTGYYLNRQINPEKKDITFYVSILWFPLLLFLTLNGSVDIGGVAGMFICILLYFDKTRNQQTRLVACGVLLASLVLFRRWFAFWCATFVLCAIMDIFIQAMQKTTWRKKLWFFFLNAGLLAGTAGGLLFVFFEPMLVEKYLLSNVASAYAAYAMGFTKDIWVFNSYFGIVLLILFAILLIACLFYKPARRRSIFLLVQALLCFFLFTRVQNHDIQHIILYIPLIFCTLSAGMGYLCRHYSCKVVCIPILCLAIINGANSFNVFNPLFRQEKISGLVQFNMMFSKEQNIDEILSLLYCLDDLVQGSEKKVAVLSDSAVLNKDMLEYAEISLNLSDMQRDYFIALPTVDSRDGFNGALFTADFVVVPNTAQCHLGESRQRAVSIPTKYFNENIGFADAYNKLTPQFVLSDGSVFSIYERVRDVTELEQAQIQKDIQD